LKWRRQESLNEQLLREGGLVVPDEPAASVSPTVGPLLPEARYRLPTWMQVTAGLKQWASEWDVIVAAHAPEIGGDEVEFVAIDDGSLVVDAEEGDAPLEPLADAVEAELSRPYRAKGIRHEGEWWTVGARRTTLCELPGIDGDTIELAVYQGERTVSGVPTDTDLSRLAALASARGLDDYAIEAERLDGDVWEAQINPL
jgi:hypothetical protein